MAEIDRVIHEQEAADPMPLKSLVEDVYAQVPRHLRVQYNDFIRVAERYGDAQPGDGQFPLESIFTCLTRIEMEDFDLVKTYRVVREDGPYRRLISAFYNHLFRMLFKTDYRDLNSKPKIIRKSKYQSMGLTSDDWFIDAEIMIRATELGLKVAEVPIHFYSIETRPSFVKAVTILEFLNNLWRFRFGRPSQAGAPKLSQPPDTEPPEEDATGRAP